MQSCHTAIIYIFWHFIRSIITCSYVVMSFIHNIFAYVTISFFNNFFVLFAISFYFNVTISFFNIFFHNLYPHSVLASYVSSHFSIKFSEFCLHRIYHIMQYFCFLFNTFSFVSCIICNLSFFFHSILL